MDLTSTDLAALKAEAQKIAAVLQVGKSGITPTFVEELDFRLKRDRLVKVKLLKSSREGHDRHDLSKELAEKTGAILVETRGYTAVLYRPKGRRRAPRSAPES